MTKTKADVGQPPQPPPTQQQQPPQHSLLRKNNVWTREKITRLIQLYRDHECLWNNYIEAYKNKEKRNEAIEDICTNLRITKFDFGKKIHNLRNQFNAEMKKLERRIEESGGDSNAIDGSHLRSRWDHYDSLLFLKEVIAPRPGYQSNGSFQQPRKIELKYQQTSDDDDSHVIISHLDHLDADATVAVSTPATEAIEEEETEYHFEEATAEEEAEQSTAEEFRNFEERILSSTGRSEDTVDQKYNPPTSMREVIITSLPSQTPSNGSKPVYLTSVHNGQQKKNVRLLSHSSGHQQHQQLKTPSAQLQLSNADVFNSNDSTRLKHFPAGAVVEFSTQADASPPQKRSKRLSESVSSTTRDQWDALGEMVAAEFRNLNSDVSRKKLKRKIMQAMLEVGEEDDGININIAIN